MSARIYKPGRFKTHQRCPFGGVIMNSSSKHAESAVFVSRAGVAAKEDS